MTTAALDIDRLLALPAGADREVTESMIDENGHMNIVHYFGQGAEIPWERMGQIGLGANYIEQRQHSFFTVEHRIGYFGELRLSEQYAVRCGFAARTDKAVHAASFVVDLERRRLACLMEIVFVHVSMTERHAVPIPDDVGQILDAEIASAPWVADVATGLTLRR